MIWTWSGAMGVRNHVGLWAPYDVMVSILSLWQCLKAICSPLNQLPQLHYMKTVDWVGVHISKYRYTIKPVYKIFFPKYSQKAVNRGPFLERYIVSFLGAESSCMWLCVKKSTCYEEVSLHKLIYPHAWYMWSLQKLFCKNTFDVLPVEKLVTACKMTQFMQQSQVCLFRNE